MKITDVTLTLFAWDDITPTQYGQHSRCAGSSALGLLRIATDDGVEGHAFLGSASNSAKMGSKSSAMCKSLRTNNRQESWFRSRRTSFFTEDPGESLRGR